MASWATFPLPASFSSPLTPPSQFFSFFFSALHQILQQIQTQALVSQRQLNVVKAQIANKERENTMQGLTLSQLEAEKTDARLYRGVGKMYVFSLSPLRP